MQRCQFVERDAQRVDVRPRIDQVRLARHLLRTHVADGPQHVAGGREAGVGIEAGQSEVGDPKLALLVQHQVRGLDVAMDDSALMGVIEGFGGLDAEPGHGAEELAALEFRGAGNGIPAGGVSTGRCRPGLPLRGRGG